MSRLHSTGEWVMSLIAITAGTSSWQGVRRPLVRTCCRKRCPRGRRAAAVEAAEVQLRSSTGEAVVARHDRLRTSCSHAQHHTSHTSWMSSKELTHTVHPSHTAVHGLRKHARFQRTTKRSGAPRDAQHPSSHTNHTFGVSLAQLVQCAASAAPWCRAAAVSAARVGFV